MGKYFGTDGFRGEANVQLTANHAFQVGRYVGWYYGRDHKAKIVIGKDTRRSSYMFEYALAAGLTASGADAYLLHVTTTPSVSYVVIRTISCTSFDVVRYSSMAFSYFSIVPSSGACIAQLPLRSPRIFCPVALLRLISLVDVICG